MPSPPAPRHLLPQAAETAMPRLRLDIDYASPLWTDRRALGALLRKAAASVFSQAYVDSEELPNPACARLLIALRLTDDADMRGLNSAFRNKDKATNVLSFPSHDAEAMDEPSFLGNIAIGYETVQREAARDGKSFTDHLVHLLVHGCLHLIGYDHQEAGEAEEMEVLEIAILAGLGLANPYADFDLVQNTSQGA